MQNDQVKGMLDRALAVLATMFLGWLAKRGWIGESDAATLVPALVLLPALAWGWWNNRPASLLASAANVVGADGKQTIVVVSPELATAVPSENVVSHAETEVKSK